MENLSIREEKTRAEATHIFFHTIIKWGYNSSSLESTRGSHTSRFGAEELESEAISPKMVEQHLEGDKVVDLGLGNLVATPVA